MPVLLSNVCKYCKLLSFYKSSFLKLLIKSLINVMLITPKEVGGLLKSFYF